MEPPFAEGFIRLSLAAFNGEPIATDVNINQITSFRPSGTNEGTTLVWMTGVTKPFGVLESPDEIREIISEHYTTYGEQ